MEMREKSELEELEEMKREGDLVETLIGRYRPLVYAAARRLCPALKRDEDLLQCGMIGLWRAAEIWDGQRPFSPLAMRYVETEMLRHLRYLSRQPKTVPLAPEHLRATRETDFTRCELESDLDRKFPPESQEHRVLAAVLRGETLSDAATAAGTSRRAIRRRLRRKAGRLLGPRDHARV